MSEYDEQKLVFAWANFFEIKYPELGLLNGSLNGVRLTIGQAVNAKLAGMKKGFPDINLPVARRGFNGLFIELKRRDGVASDVKKEQKKWLTGLSKNGYHAVVCFGADEAIAVLQWYLYGK
jgi:hypothetical protein